MRSGNFLKLFDSDLGKAIGEKKVKKLNNDKLIKNDCLFIKNKEQDKKTQKKKTLSSGLDIFSLRLKGTRGRSLGEGEEGDGKGDKGEEGGGVIGPMGVVGFLGLLGVSERRFGLL